MSIECAGIICDGDSLYEVEDGHISIRLRLEDVKRVELGHGFQSPHPFLQIALALVLIAPGCFAAVHFFFWVIYGGTFSKLGAGLIPFAVIGVWLLAAAINRGFYLDVYTTQGRRRLGFNDDASFENVRTFLPVLCEHLQMSIASTIPGIPSCHAR